jgi:hypothetical protein
MDPKEKALELVQKYFKSNHQPYGFKDAKQCALIAVDEILEALKIDLDKDLSTIDVANFVSNKIIYWEEVKQEIEKL